MTSGLFVTGTGTGVGKTAIAAALAAELEGRGVDVWPLKPVETGWPQAEDWPRDAALLASAAGRSDLSRDAVAPEAFHEPLAPTVAARRAGREVDVDRLDEAFSRARASSDLVLVEGAGGLLVPVTEELTMLDLADRWSLPLLVVARPGLGTLNHTALTVEQARHRGLDVVGIVVDRYPEDPDVATRTNPAELERLTDEPVLGTVPDVDGLDTQTASLDGLHEIADALDLTRIFDRLDRTDPRART